MAEVTWAGNSIITDIQGTWTFAPGMMQPVWLFEGGARFLGEYDKRIRLAGCDHVVTVIYLSLTSSQVTTQYTALLNLQSPANGSEPGKGSLVVPMYGTFANCRLTNVAPSEPTFSALINASGYAGERVDAEFTLTFHQTRR